MKAENFEAKRKGKQKTNETSALVAILKTIAFFAVIIGIIGFFVYLGAGGKTISKDTKTNSGYETLDISDLADYDYYTPLPGEKADENLLAANKIPDDVKALNGKKIAVSGFMMPVEVDDKGMVAEFALNGNYDMCFYGAPSSINQWVHVKTNADNKARFSHSPITVYGTLEVGEHIIDGEVVSLYRLQADKVGSGQRARW